MSRPQPDVYHLPDLEIDFSVKKLIVSMVCVVLFLILPITLIESLNNNPVTSTIPVSDQVAGVSTTANYINLFGEQVNLNSQTGLIALVGMLLIGLSIIFTLYLIGDGLIRKRK